MRTILVIDDNVAVLSTLIYLLEEQGYRVVSAENGDAGARIYRSQRPDLVIADLIMPEQGGIDTIREIKRQCPEAKIIAISAAHVSAMPIRSMRHAKSVPPMALAKPLDPDDFIEVVNDVLAA